ncbi:alpha-1,2-fucosyltransferase [Pedobacter xixiisoli]|uniref:Glycosyl transferase family 11 n=1 Tax=Pedobacter xixiisoli TaxID=1476464 RepID=A0A286A9S2_9SPHI|nr:alpha-1,2-fucosyltransferase [Pedobacter xixiisoli]SOD18654.1 Glycosyl transferase family 11 [Pedobacter xixiisoli]
MIGVKLHGRLGNQLFQYAFIYTAAAKLGTTFYLDESIDRFLVSRYFEIKEKPIAIFRRFIFNLSGIKRLLEKPKIQFFESLKRRYQLSTTLIDGKQFPKAECLKIKEQTLFEGFFQSEKYFETEKQALKNLLSIKPKYIKLFKQYVKQLVKEKTMVTIHVRRGDYLTANWQLTSSYYHQAIAKIHHPNNFYVFITDDRDFVAKEFADITPQHISSASEIIDLQFLINADINILSNSSFSWWGAYLNKNNAQTIAPALWLGQSEVYPNSILCSNWQLI